MNRVECQAEILEVRTQSGFQNHDNSVATINIADILCLPLTLTCLIYTTTYVWDVSTAFQIKHPDLLLDDITFTARMNLTRTSSLLLDIGFGTEVITGCS